MGVFSVGATSRPDLLETEGPFTQESRPGRNFGEAVGGIFALDCSDWSNGLPFDTVTSIPDPTPSLNLPCYAMQLLWGSKQAFPMQFYDGGKQGISTVSKFTQPERAGDRGESPGLDP